MTPSAVTPPAAIGPGSMLAGKYRIERVLGRGGMGVVFEALHADLGQRVAIKLLLPDALESGDAVERFLREGRATAKLTTPHVAKVFDVGRLESGEPYLVMELLRGRDLQALVDGAGAQPLLEVLRWGREAAEALAEAHAHGIVHRDIKPANLFLAELPSGKTTIKVVDFGISKQVQTGAVDLTQTSSTIGSPLYMAPEQMRSAKHVDLRVDVWSLGVVLYEMATGEPPFMGGSLTEVVSEILLGEPIPPSRRRPGLPPAFDAVVLRCLSKAPTGRFSSMGELDAALASLLSPFGTTGHGLASFEEGAPTLAAPPRLPSVALTAPEIRSTAGAWDATRSPPAGTRSRGGTWIALIAGGMALVAGTVTLIVVSTTGPEGATGASGLSGTAEASSQVAPPIEAPTTTVAPTSTPSEAPPVVSASGEAPSSTVAPSASAATSASAPPKRAPRGGPGGSGGTPPPPRTARHVPPPATTPAKPSMY